MYKLFIVEDEMLLRKGLIYTEDWAALDMTIVGEADNGQSGYDGILRERPDIIITDIRMPKLDGLEMVRKLRETYEFASIILTGYSEFDYVKKALALDAVDYLLKPVDDLKLADAVRRAILQVERMRSFKRLHGGETKYSPDPREGFIPGSDENYYVKAAQGIIFARYHEKLTLSGVAQEIGVSESYLNRKLKSTLSCTFLNYLNRQRIMQAVELLKEGKLRVSEIAEAVGFSEYRQFVAVFQRYIGTSPTKFIRDGGWMKK